MHAPSDTHLHQISFLQKHKVIIPYSLPASTFKLRTAGQRPPNRLVLSHRLIQYHKKLTTVIFNSYKFWNEEADLCVQKLRIINHTCVSHTWIISAVCAFETNLLHVTRKQSIDRHKYKEELKMGPS